MPSNGLRELGGELQAEDSQLEVLSHKPDMADTSTTQVARVPHSAPGGAAISVNTSNVELEPAQISDDDPRLDPMAHSFPWAQFLIPPKLRTIDPEAANRVKPGRLLHMLPFKVWVRHSVIGAELDNGPSRVWLTKHPLSSNDFVLDPDRVAKASLCWHRFPRTHFFLTMLKSVSVIFTTVLAIYLSFFAFVQQAKASKTGTETIAHWLEIALGVFSLAYPLITSWVVMSIAWEQSMRREIYYVLLHFKILLDLENYSWTPNRRFAKSELLQLFPAWMLFGSECPSDDSPSFSGLL